MRARIVDHQIIPFLDLREHPVNGKFVIILAKRSRHVIHVVAGRILLAKHRDMMVCAVHGGTHQIHRAGIHTDILLVGVFLVNRLCHECTVRACHKAPHLRINRRVPHTRGHKHLIKNLVHAFADHPDIIGFLIGLVSNAHAAGKVDKIYLHTHLLLDLYRQFKELLRKLGIILVGHRIAGKERVEPETPHPFILQNAVSLKKLLRRKAVLGIAWIVHNTVAHLEHAARIVTAAHGLGQFPQNAFHKVDMRDVVQIDDASHFRTVFVLLCRGIVGGKHDILPVNSQSVAQHQLRQRGAVAASAVLMHDLDQERIRTRLHRKILLKSLIPRKSLLHGFRVLPDAFLVIDMERRGVCLHNLFYLFLRHKR